MESSIAITDYRVPLGLSVTVAALIATKIFSNKSKGKKIPFVKGGFPFLGQVFKMLAGSPWDKMASWAREYGGIYMLHLFGSSAFVISDPDLLKIILSTKLSKFRKDTKWTYKPFMDLLGNGIVTAEGDDWMRQRKLLSSHLRIEILEEIPEMAVRAVQRLMVKLDKAKAEGVAVEMAEEFRHLTLQVIAEAFMSLPPEESDVTFARMYLPIVEEGNLRTWRPDRMYTPNPAWFKYKAAVKTLNDYVSGIITRRWELRQQEAKAGGKSGRKSDVLDKILGAIDPEEWGPEWIKQIRDEMKTFVLAGHETSASMLTWSLYELTVSKEKTAKLREETAAVYKNMDTRTMPTPPPKESLAGLQFAECCLRESLRKYSNVPSVVRMAAEDIEVGEYFVPKGSTLMLNLQGAHHDPKHWPEPEQWRPERFLGPITPYTFVAFAEGPRMCLGQYLSLLETKIVLSMLVHTYDFELVNKDTAGQKHPFMVPIIPNVGHYVKLH